MLSNIIKKKRWGWPQWEKYNEKEDEWLRSVWQSEIKPTY
jgi:hypothetical protein